MAMAMAMEVSSAKMMKMDVDDDDGVALCFPATRKSSNAKIVHDDDDDDETLCFPAKRKASDAKIVHDDDDDETLCFPAKRKSSNAKIVHDDDDDETLCFPAKRKSSTARISQEDGDDVAQRKSTAAKVVDDDDDYDASPAVKKRTRSEKVNKSKEKHIDIEDDFAEIEGWSINDNVGGGPPLKRRGDDDHEELDISGAALVEVDAKEFDKDSLNDIVNFASHCRQKYYLQLFNFPGDPRSGGSLSAASYTLVREYRDLVVTALKEYRKVNQNAKMKLRDILNLDFELGGGLSYITFTAEDKTTGEIKTYQAALLKDGDRDFLGLLRNVVDDKVLAILSVKGTEEDLAADEDEFWRMWEERLAEENEASC